MSQHSLVVYQKTIASIIGNGEKSKALPLKSGTNPGVHSVHSLSPVPGFLLEQDGGEKQRGTKRKGKEPSVLITYTIWLYTEDS